MLFPDLSGLWRSCGTRLRRQVWCRRPQRLAELAGPRFVWKRGAPCPQPSVSPGRQTCTTGMVVAPSGPRLMVRQIGSNVASRAGSSLAGPTELTPARVRPQPSGWLRPSHGSAEPAV